MPPWLAGDLAHVTGAGPARAALQAARKLDKRSQASAYYDAFEGEAAWVAGDQREAEALLARAAADLPAAEQLLRARVFAMLADLRLERGASSEAFQDFERSLQIDPGVVRRLGLALPVRIASRGDAVAEGVVDALESSPRFDAGTRGLSLQVNATRAGGDVCLIGASGAQLACGHVDAKANDPSEVVVEKLVADVHERVFAPNVDLSQIDANSLDGSNLRGSQQDLKGLLEGEGME
jgi:hypothetical protein